MWERSRRADWCTRHEGRLPHASLHGHRVRPDGGGYAKSRNKLAYVHRLRKTLSKIPNLRVLVSQEIWNVMKDRQEKSVMVVQDDMTSYPAGGGVRPPEPGDEGHHVVSVEFDMSLFYRIILR